MTAPATTLLAGFGVTGRAVARALVARGEQPAIVDDRPDAAGRRLAQSLGLWLIESPSRDQLAGLVGQASRIIPSPGLPPHHPVLTLAADLAVPVRSEIELAWELLTADTDGGRAPRLVAVTGTNGKTTVTTLVAAILDASGTRAETAGNIGRPLIDFAGGGGAAGRPEVIAVEVSSFQLQHTERFHPQVSCWLNLAPDHLDWHPTMHHYAAAKARIWANQGPGDVAVVNADDPAVMAAAAEIPGGVRRVTFSLGAGADYTSNGVLAGPGGEPIIPVDRLRRALPHDRANALAAIAAAAAAGATAAGAAQALATAAGLPHRVELVTEADGVRWYDDSKATTPASVLAACAGLPSVILIAGGRNKGLDLGVLAQAVPPVRAVVAIGESSAEVRAAFAGLVPVTEASSMADAVAAAATTAQAGDAVLLSPGCASFDWYPSYAARGDEFAAQVRARLGRGRGAHPAGRCPSPDPPPAPSDPEEKRPRC